MTKKGKLGDILMDIILIEKKLNKVRLCVGISTVKISKNAKRIPDAKGLYLKRKAER